MRRLELGVIRVGLGNGDEGGEMKLVRVASSSLPLNSELFARRNWVISQNGDSPSPCIVPRHIFGAELCYRSPCWTAEGRYWALSGLFRSD